MDSKLFIAVAIGVAIGLGVGFGLSRYSENNSQEFDMQTIRQMMLDDPDAVQKMIMATMQDSDQMKMIEDMMQRMKDDPELEQAMMEHMNSMKSSREVMMDTGENNMMTGMIKDSTIKQDLDKTSNTDSIDFSSICVTQISENSATVEGGTDQKVFCEVEYGIDGMFTDSASDDMDMMSMAHYKHKAVLSDLESNTSYDYRFKASLGDQTFYSDIRTFTTK